MPININSEFFIKTLKKRIKKSSLTYKDISRELKISEAGVKKILSNRDISMARAYELCALIGVSISDLYFESQEELAADIKFTTEQINQFAKNHYLFHFYMRLAYEKIEISELKRDHNLSDLEIFKFLKKLDDLELIILHKDNKFSLVDGPAMRLKTAGTKLDQIKFDATRRLLSRIEKEAHPFLRGGIFLLDNVQIENMKAEIFSFNDKYTKLSSLNRSVKNKDQKKKFSTQTTLVLSSASSLFDIQSDL